MLVAKLQFTSGILVAMRCRTQTESRTKDDSQEILQTEGRQIFVFVEFGFLSVKIRKIRSENRR
jgi:hypothetical protein